MPLLRKNQLEEDPAGSLEIHSALKRYPTTRQGMAFSPELSKRVPQPSSSADMLYIIYTYIYIYIYVKGN